MPDEYFLSASGAGSSPGERVLWSGHCAVAEYAFEEPASLPRWTLPEDTEVVVTAERVVYRDTATGATGELSWPWPQHLRVQPGNRDSGRAGTVTQIQLVCAGPDGTFPALVFAGGDLATVGDADRLANVLRHAIARYRVEHATELGIPAIQVRVLSRLVIGPEFNNRQGGDGQTVSLLGATPVRQRPAEGSIYGRPDDDGGGGVTMLIPATYISGRPVSAEPVSGGSVSSAPISGASISSAPVSPTPVSPTPVYADAVDRMRSGRPGLDADAVRAHRAHGVEVAADSTQPDLASRAAELAARVANLVSGGVGPDGPFQTETTNLSAFLDPTPAQPVDPAERAEQIRRTAARLAANSARARSTVLRRSEDDLGANTPGTQRGR